MPRTICLFASEISALIGKNYFQTREEAVKKFDRKVMAENYLNEYRNVISGSNW